MKFTKVSSVSPAFIPAVFNSFIDGFLDGKKARNILPVQAQPADREAMHFTLSGIGLYAPGRTQFKSGIFKIHETKRTDPSVDDPTCYTAVLDTWVPDSFKPFTRTFYPATGTAQQIRAQFREIHQAQA